MLRIDIGCGTHKAKGFVGVDIISAPGVDIVADLSKKFPFSNSSVDELRAHDFIEHLADKIHTMNEIWRVCKPDAKVDIRVPSTDGRGAFQDPTHISFWNINSFFYYCIDFPDYWQLCRQYGFQGAFKVIGLEHEESPGHIIHVKANLLVVKSENSLVVGADSSVSQITTSEKPQSEKITSSSNTLPQIDLAELLNQIEQYKKDSSDISTLENLRRIRLQIANECLKEIPNKEDKDILIDLLSKTYNALLQDTIKLEPLTENEQIFVTELVELLSQGFDKPKAVSYLLALMLYYRADQLPLPNDLKKIPQWFLKDYLKFLLRAPRYFKEIGEADHYYQYLLRWVNYLHDNIIQKIHQSSFWQDVALYFLENASFLQIYFNEANLKEIYVKRAEILESFLRTRGHEIDWEFPPYSTNIRKIRIGILASHFIPASETFASLPIYEYISRDFEVILYSLSLTGQPMEQYCQSCANSYRLLPTNLTDQVDLIRGDDLDILFIATNVTIGTNPICLLALHRLARIQVTSVASVVTTGMRNIDYYISGKLTEPTEDAQKHYKEKLLKIEGAAHCFSYGCEINTGKIIGVKRENFGLSKEKIVFISGANAFKITPELKHTWAKILAAVPNSVLVLYPWGPNWSDNYPKQSLTRSFNGIFTQYGVQPDKLILLDPEPIPNRDDIKEYLKLADIYLDSYPFSGTTSIIDPLEVGIPVITRQGNYFRGAMGAALLLELGMPDLVVNSEESYIQLATSLGIDSELRQKKSELIKQKMQKKPRFLDSRAYSAQVETLFQELIRTYWVDALSNELRLRNINLIIFPDWKQQEESLLQDLTSIIKEVLTHPDRSQITLLVDTNNISDEEADLAVSSIVMNILMEEDLDVSEGAEISLIGERSEIQWEAILRLIHTRIIFEGENQQAIIQAKAESISFCELESLSEKRAVQLETGSWELR